MSDQFAEAMSGWRPAFRPPTDHLLAQRSRLQALPGRRLVTGWTGREPRAFSWASSMPLVLVFDGGPQLEIAWRPDHQLSLTWDTVDLTKSPKGVFGPRHFWRASEPKAVAAIAGRTVTGIGVAEQPSFLNHPDLNLNGPDLPLDMVAHWRLKGVWIECGEVRLYDINGSEARDLTNDSQDWFVGQWTRMTRLEDWPPPGAPTA